MAQGFSYLFTSNSTLHFIFTAFSLFIVLNLFIRYKSKVKKPLNLPPGSYGWPFLGETMEYFQAAMEGKPQNFVKRRMEKYKSCVFKTSIVGEPMAVLCGTAGNKFLFTNSNKLVTTWWPSSVSKLLGPCITTLSGDEAMQMRKMISYFFSPDAFVKLYIKTMDLVTQQHIETHWQGKEEVNVYPNVRLYTFEVACRLFMRIEEQEQIEKLADLFNIFVKGVISVPINFPGTKFYNAKRATSAIKKELKMFVRHRRLALEQKTSLPSQDLLSHLLSYPDENGKFMSESVIINNIVLLLFSGYDTTSAASTILMKYLAEFPEIYENVLKEQMEIASSKEGGELLNWDDIQKMRYSWNVACEAIRIYPPVMGAFREAMADLKFEGYDIPKGWKFYWNAPLTHTDPSFFPDEQKFDPSRFEGAGPVPYSYVPFGGGPRMCLGKEFTRLEILIFLHNIVKRFKWDLLIPDEKIEYEMTLRPQKGLPVRLHPRQA
ncbi:Cytochrome [Forsythia ovata]|uniref:Cytochrome n=1 Tax=Forsythia ovata TaxID=205694 RepID=A0ABD1RH37_9LAMI